MKANFSSYEVASSAERMSTILNAKDESFEELNNIPPRDKLTFDNGFYIYCTALFVDIRDSSRLPNKYKRPALARLYRSYISETVAVLNGNVNCTEISIVGDAIGGVFDTPYKPDIDSVFSTAAEVNSMIKILNYKFGKHGIEPIKIGIGIAYGRALMIKAGFFGSAINDVVWMGDVVNEASKLSDYANSSYSHRTLFVSPGIYSNLNEHNCRLLGMFNGYGPAYGNYHGEVINTVMETWYQEHCK